MDEFRRRRIADIRELVTPELVEAHRLNPRGPHSHELNLVLNFVRGPAHPMERKSFVYLKNPYDSYGLALMAGRGEPAEIVEGAEYSSEADAVHGAFLQRLHAHGLDDLLEGNDNDV
ncbi:hypothetical protein GIY30_19100 [Gordonia sp. HNM0687]|uniref:N,N-dimethylformamidase alpha subunit domain-containing protein n=1 Tax=Gordonia mangrovi TaxID=2665643 RepID=A0A6L7GU68_9ACTN|nr:hypothetical protein [Gordonia mangrovi]MXP23450.1 hypothetical protein [Gordonia mangrovi]UVF76654.1 hypothetical protein NWF22_14905 [Gordonia mangrovi]